MKRLNAVLSVCAAAMLCLTGCMQKIEPVSLPLRAADDIIYDTVRSYGDGADRTQTDYLLGELKAADSSCGELWSGIMDYWKAADMTMPHTTARLPEGLPEDETLCIIVLGYQLNPDGSMQPELVGRLRTALTCAKQYPEAMVLCTGGGTAYLNRSTSEAQQMGKWLTAHGLDERRLILEDQSLTTAENARFSAGILYREQPQVTSAAIVTSTYHIPWGALMFETEFRLCSAEGGVPEIHVDACCAYECSREGFGDAENLSCQTAGMLYLLSEHETAEADEAASVQKTRSLQ